VHERLTQIKSVQLTSGLKDEEVSGLIARDQKTQEVLQRSLQPCMPLDTVDLQVVSEAFRVAIWRNLW